jgi:hypothetical protein
MMKVLLFALALVGVSSLNVKKDSLRPALKLRGGLAGVDAKQVATAASWFLAANGAYFTLAPEPALKAYGAEDTSFIIQKIMHYSGTAFISTAVLSLVMLATDDANKAMGWSGLPWLIVTLSAILNGDSEKMGLPAFNQPFLLSLCAATMYCAFTGTGMPMVGKLYAGWCLLNGIGAVLAPSKFSAAWGLSSNDKVDAMMKGYGYNLVIYGVVAYLVLNGDSVVSAVGYGWAIALLNLIDGLFVTKHHVSLGVKTEPMYAWLIINAAIAAFTLF